MTNTVQTRIVEKLSVSETLRKQGAWVWIMSRQSLRKILAATIVWTNTRERGNSAVKSFHLKVRKAPLQRFISRDNAMVRNGRVDTLSQLILRKALWPELFAVPRLFCSRCVLRLSLNLRSLWVCRLMKYQFALQKVWQEFSFRWSHG